MVREVEARERDIDDLINAASGDAIVVLKEGWTNIASSQAANCDDLNSVLRGMVKLEAQQNQLGVKVEIVDNGVLSGMLARIWDVCLAEKTDKCLAAGAVQILPAFIATMQRAWLNASNEQTEYVLTNEQFTQVQAAMERCGRYKLQFTSRGEGEDEETKSSYSFQIYLPLRLVFDGQGLLTYVIRGEAPATGVNVDVSTNSDRSFAGFQNSGPMKAIVNGLQFFTGQDLRPLTFKVLVSAPGIAANVACEGMTIPLPVTESGWYFAHPEDRNGDNFFLRRFKGLQHPTLFEMEWSRSGADDNVSFTDDTTIKLIHIAQ
jgi:hypothetical protein